MSRLVTIFGGSGFVGRYIARRMAKEGWRVRVAVRRPNQALFVKPYGVVGQVEPVFCNIRDDASVRAVLTGADAVVNCVGILAEAGKNSFAAVQGEAPGRIARIAAELCITRMVHISALGADAGSDSAYARSKAQGEAAIREILPEAMILRPSVIFGPEDRFFNRFARMARSSAVLPLVGAETRFQPVFVDDVAHAAALYLTGKAAGGTYELGGPEVKTFRELMKDMLHVIRRRRAVVSMPFGLAGIMACGFGLAEKISLGLYHNTTLTADQLKLLHHDSIVTEGARGFAELGFVPTAYEAVLPDYLWPYREGGQYNVLRESGRNLKI